jgi:nucleoside-diphosphate-sugar epimerase
MMTRNDHSIAIIGCGWLGKALAKELILDEVSFVGTCQSEQSLIMLKNMQIPSIQLRLPLTGSISDICGLLDREVMVIAIPPQLKKGQTDYVAKIAQLVQIAEAGTFKRIILLNTTAIYGGLSRVVSEETLLDESTDKVSILLAAEQALATFSGQSYVLRLAGLVGPERHPGKFLQANKVFKNANAQVNLVHQTDVVNIIKILSQLKDFRPIQTVYNVNSQTTCNRKHYYQLAAQSLALAKPDFEEDNIENTGKNISATKLREALAYHYHYDDLLDWLGQSNVKV